MKLIKEVILCREQDVHVHLIRDEAVAAAMILFWEYGFESTSLAQLKAAMGDISSASFYAAFKSKEDLFREVIDRYISMYGLTL